MDSREYQRLYLKIGEKLKAKCEEIERLYAELVYHRHALVDALNTLWRLEHDGPPPKTAKIDIPAIRIDSKEPLPKSHSNGNAPADHEELKTRNDVIRHIVRQFNDGDEVTAQVIMEQLESNYPDVARELKGRTTIVSKVLRGMVEKDELKRIKEGVGFNPTIYRKVKSITVNS
jgi:hypothetical protein